MKSFFMFLFLVQTLLFAQSSDGNLTLREKITNNYHGMLNKIDCYLGGFDDANHTNIHKISKNKLTAVLSLKTSRDHAIESNLYLHANIKLPKLQERFEITLSKQSQSDIDNRRFDTDFERAIEDEKFRIGIKYNFYKTLQSALYTKIGLRLHAPFGVYGQFGAEQNYHLGAFELVFGDDLYYYIYHDYFVNSAKVTFYRPLNDIFSLEQRNELIYNQSSDTSKLEHLLRLNHYLDEKNKLQYQLSLLLIDDQDYHFSKDWYGAQIKLRHALSKWIFVEVAPQLFKREQNHFEYETALIVNFGVVFAK